MLRFTASCIHAAGRRLFLNHVRIEPAAVCPPSNRLVPSYIQFGYVPFTPSTWNSSSERPNRQVDVPPINVIPFGLTPPTPNIHALQSAVPSTTTVFLLRPKISAASALILPTTSPTFNTGSGNLSTTSSSPTAL